MNETGQESRNVTSGDTSTERVSYSLLDQSMWNSFRAAGSPAEYVHTWLALQCRRIPGARAAVVVLGAPDVGPYAPVASWPDEETTDTDLMQSANASIQQRQTRLVTPENGSRSIIAVPVEVDGALFGTVGLVLVGNDTSAAEATRRIRWGLGWLESLLRREQGARDTALRDRTMAALEFLSVVLNEKRFDASCTALVTELSRKLECDPVGIGFIKRKTTRVQSISQTADFGRRMNLVKDMALAMDEAIDQNDLVQFPTPDTWEYRVTRMHEDLVRSHRTGAVLTLPMSGEKDIIGAITLEKRDQSPFDDEIVELCDVVATMVGPILEIKRRDDRNIIVKVFSAFFRLLGWLLGPRHFGLKLATLAFAGLSWAALTVTSDFTIGSPARIEGLIQRSVVAPFNGYLSTERVRAGEEVTEGQILATLDDQDLLLERLRLETSRRQREAEYDNAFASRDLSSGGIIKSQINQIDAQLGLVDQQLERTRLTAPFDGFIVEGDLSQSIGSSIERGEVLFKIAPLNAYRVVLEVDERDISLINDDLGGVLRLSARPNEDLPFSVTSVTPIAAQGDGRNFFRVEASLDAKPGWVRPSMEGAARTLIDERLVAEIWTRRLVNWAQLFFWKFQP